MLDYAEHAMSSGGDAQAAAYVEGEVDGEVLWGVGVDAEHRHRLAARRRRRRQPRCPLAPTDQGRVFTRVASESS